MRRRAVVSYEDLPHDTTTLHNAAVEAGTAVPASKKRRKHEQEQRYHGPHWDDVSHTTAKPAPAWSHTPNDDDEDDEDASHTAYDSDDAIVASPTHEEPFLEDIELPSGNALASQEIWDDQFLLDAWNAAEEEYAVFHQQRSEAIDAFLAQNKQAHWYSLPTAAVQDAAAQAERDDHAVAGPSDHATVPASEPVSAPASAPVSAPASAPDTPRAATRGWLEAQRIVAATPNQINGAPSARAQTDAAPPHPAALPSLALPAARRYRTS
ncbi:hypothetical protein MBRA1_000952 [Malassezia brasiliensis]|uniref:Uncharacterized protein n=1 Tax=Malassezia brasiliensis TaxID=1821822 RepID=A0AAF0IMV0_9BASI|nr:hypothetical protein MBRA1_000952 [Malassezia brasiliensis]